MTFSKFGHGSDLDEWSRRIHDIMDEMRNRSFVDFRDTETWQPATDVYETRDRYFICVELAGVQPNAVDLVCPSRNRIVITGSRNSPRPAGIEGPLSVHVMEIDHGSFRREVQLPEPVDVDAVKATYDKGYLWIALPKITTE